MCSFKMIDYTCGCVRIMEFVQCDEAKGSGQNIKCNPVKRVPGRKSPNYCERHLVYPVPQQ